MARLYCGEKIITEGMYSNGMPNYYMIYKLPKETLQIVFKEGKPEDGTLPIALHNGLLLGLDFKKGMPAKATLFKDDGRVKEILFDVSSLEMKNAQPWNGEFLSMEAKKIEKYVDGKIVSTKDCECLGFIEEIIERFSKNTRTGGKSSTKRNVDAKL
mgnify:CR=1 FL=1